MTIIKSKLSMTCAFLFLFLALVFCVGAAPAHAEPAPGATDAILTFQLTEFPDEYRNDVTVSIENTDTGDTYDITAHYVGTYTNTLHVLKGHYQITGVDIHDYNNVGYALTLDPGGTLLDETDGFDVTYGKPRGFFAPAGTDEAVLQYISAKMAEVCEMPEFIEAMANLGFTVAYVDGPAAKERTISWAESLTPVFEDMAKIAG